MADATFGPRKIKIVGSEFQVTSSSDNGMRELTCGQASIPAALSTTVDTGLATIDLMLCQTQASTVVWPTGDFPGEGGDDVKCVGQAAGKFFWKAIGTR